MSAEYLLDTNAMIAVIAGDTLLVSLLRGKTIAVPSIVFGELYFGAAKSARSVANRAQVDAYLARVAVADVTIDVARAYGNVRDQLRRKGRPIPGNDIWIAAIARAFDLTLVTRDGHFQEVTGLRIQSWGQGS